MHEKRPYIINQDEPLRRRIEKLERENKILAAQAALDTARRKEVEAVLSERQRQLSEAQRLAHIGSWSWTVGSEHVSWSDELFRIYGYTPHNGQVAFTDYIDLIHPDDRTRVLESLERNMRQGGQFEFIHRIVRPDGEIRMVQGRGEIVQSPDGTPMRMFGTAQDVTERLEAETTLRRSREELEQRVAERTAELREAEHRFRVIVEASPTPLLLSRLSDGVILYANARLERLIGAEPGALEGGKTVSFYYDPDLRKEVVETLRQKGCLQDFELQIRRIDGTPLWVSLTARRVVFDGEPAIATTLLDISERMATAEALRASEESFRHLFNNLTDLVYVQDLEGRFINVNEAVVRAYGYSREELVGQTPAILAAPGLVDLDAVMEAFSRAVAGEPQRFEWIARRKDGTTFPKEVVIKRSTYFGQDVVIAVARDISEREEAAAALRRSEQHFRRLIENVSDLITILDTDGTIRYESPAITEMLGYEPSEMIGTNAFDYIAPEDVPATMTKLRYVLENPGQSSIAEFRFRHKDGSWRTLEAVGSTLSPDSVAEGIVVNSRDITARRQAEAALHESERRYAESLERELELGREIQQGFLPAELPELPGWEINARFHPARQVAGDFYDAFELAPGRVAFLIGDVCGKGVGAALFMAIFRSLMRAYSESANLNYSCAECDAEILKEAMRATNEYVNRLHRPAHVFASAFFGLLDPSTSMLNYINAGHEPPMIIGPDGIRERLLPTGPALGIIAGAPFTVGQRIISRGEVLLTYTDGITEARNTDREFFTDERLMALLSRPAHSAEGLLDRIEDAVNRFTGEAQPSDDYTLLALRHEGA